MKKTIKPYFNIFILLVISIVFLNIIYQGLFSNTINFSYLVYFDRFNFSFNYIENPKEFIFIVAFSLIIGLASLFLLYKSICTSDIKIIHIFYLGMFILLSFPFLGFLFFLIY